MQIHSRLSRLNTARGSGTGLVTVGPAKVKACKSLLFTKDVSEKLPYLHLVTKKYFKLGMKNMGLCLNVFIYSINS